MGSPNGEISAPQNRGIYIVKFNDKTKAYSFEVSDDSGMDCENGSTNYPRCDNGGLSVVITEPNSLITIGHSPVTVKGTVNHPNAILVVNGNVISHSNGKFEAQVTVEEGYNTIIASVTEGPVAQDTDTISASLDLTPPYVTIDSHTDDQTISATSITVTGLVNDIVRGTVEAEQAHVTVNGVVAQVSNRSYAAKNIPLVVGQNQIKVIASDQVGNTETKIITINNLVAVGNRVLMISGDDQTGAIDSTLGQPLVVKLVNAAGQPIANSPVVFRVTQDSGSVAAGTPQEGRAVVVQSNASGIASTKFHLGLRTGVSNNKIKAAAVGFATDVTFTASATPVAGNKLSVNSGNNQRGVVGQLLPAPLVVVVTDEGANVVKNARVRFESLTGGGNFEGEGSVIEVLTDSDGRATARYVLGQLEGLDAQNIRATLMDTARGQRLVAGFSATAFVPADPGLTAVSGVVLDNQDIPIPGITMYIEGTTRKAKTDQQGKFRITSAPVGPIHLVADGSTATVAGEFPNLSFRLVNVAGVDNPLASPIYMVKLNTEEAVYAGKEDVALTLDKFPGFKLEIAKNSVTFPDGSREGFVSVTAVNASAVPMAPPNGMQPQFIVTIQPTGTRFDLPARLSLPNVDGHAPGAQIEMFSYDHDLEEFVSIGLGSVSEDGSVIRSNPGVGVVKAGWHCGAQPGGSGTGEHCATCKKCDGTTCVDDPAQANNPKDPQTPEDCKINTCSGEQADSSDKPKDKEFDCKKPECNGMNPEDVADDNDIKEEDRKCKKCDEKKLVKDTEKDESKCSDSPGEECYTCRDGECGNHCTVENDPPSKSEGGLAVEILNEKVGKVSGELSRSPFLKVEISGVNASGSVEQGKECCKDCGEGPEPKNYNLYKGQVSGSLKVKAAIPGTGYMAVMPRESFGDVVISGSADVGLIGQGNMQVSGAVNYKDSDCQKDDNSCTEVNVTLAGAVGASLGAAVSGKIEACNEKKFTDCSDLAALSTEVSAPITISGSAFAKSFYGCDNPKPACSGYSYGAITAKPIAKLTVTLGGLFYVSLEKEVPITLTEGGGSGNCN